MLDRAKHEILMKNILRDIYQHPILQAQLAFKDGTCLYFFHNLPRFSTDLDFSMVTGAQEAEFNSDILGQIFSQYVTIREYADKRFTWFWLGSYEKGLPKKQLESPRLQIPS
jgi:predicted nucleotidyltransferase component of viral defense system